MQSTIYVFVRTTIMQLYIKNMMFFLIMFSALNKKREGDGTQSMSDGLGVRGDVRR